MARSLTRAERQKRFGGNLAENFSQGSVTTIARDCGNVEFRKCGHVPAQVHFLPRWVNVRDEACAVPDQCTASLRPQRARRTAGSSRRKSLTAKVAGVEQRSSQRERRFSFAGFADSLAIFAIRGILIRRHYPRANFPFRRPRRAVWEFTCEKSAAASRHA